MLKKNTIRKQFVRNRIQFFAEFYLLQIYTFAENAFPEFFDVRNAYTAKLIAIVKAEISNELDVIQLNGLKVRA